MSNSYEQFFKKAQENKRADQEDARLRTHLQVKRRKRPPFPRRAAIALVLILGLGGSYLLAPDYFLDLADRIDIQAVGLASAESKAAGKSSSATSEKEKTAASAARANPDKGLGTGSEVPADLSHFEKLKQRKEELDMREKELSELEEELQKQKVELDKRIVQLEEMRNQIAQVLKDRVEVDQEKVTKLVDLYSNMKPKQAADVIGSINEDLAVEVLAKMKKKSAAEIMNLLPQEKARVLSEKYTGYRRNHGEKG
jgi:flagellar motility protein MotE (MotC chaperone)